MEVTPVVSSGRQLIQRYGGGTFVISGETYEGSVYITPAQTFRISLSAFCDITMTKVEERVAQGTELLIIGSGARQEFLAPEIREALRKKGIAVECMDTGAACRTYNILLAEDRKVAALLIAV